MKSLRAKILVHITLSILIVEGLLLVGSLVYHRQAVREVFTAAPHPGLVPGTEAYAAVEQDYIRAEMVGYALRISGMVVLVVLGTVGLVYFSLTRIVLNPVHRLIQANLAEANGDTNVALIREEEIPDDEIGAIMRSRAHMLRELHHMQNALKFLNDDLEEEVAERTRALQDTLEELKDSQAQLIQAEKLASVGAVSTGIVHELAQPLSAILLRTQILRNNKAPDPGEVQEAVRDISQYAGHMKKVMDNLRRFSRKPGKPHPMALNTPVEQACNIIRHHLANRNIHLHTRLDPDLNLIHSDETLIQQIVLNLLANARDALDEIDDKREKHITITTREEQDHAVITVHDNGAGMNAEQQEKLFESFYTTKPPEKGTGLGMFIVRKIMQDLRGEITFESQVGQGTTFILRFPVLDPAAGAEAPLPDVALPTP